MAICRRRIPTLKECHRNRMSPILIILTFLFLITGSVEEMNSFQITTDQSDQRYPAVYKDIVVWQDNRNQNWDIYGLNLTTGEEFQITTDPNDQVFPVIYEDIIFWMNERHDINTLQGYNRVTKEDILLPHHPEPHGRPALYDTMIVWEGSGGGGRQICGYSLLTQEIVRFSPSSARQYNPAIFKDMVVWEDRRDLDWIIYGYDLLTGEEIIIGEKGRHILPHEDQRDPAIYNDLVVWLEGYDEDVYGYNLATQKRITIAATSLDECYSSSDWWTPIAKPALYENIVIWVDCKNGNRDIYGYNLVTDQEFQVTSNSKSQQSPAIYKNFVVWEDDRNGDWDIYGFDLSQPVNAAPVNSRKNLLFKEYLYVAFILVPLIGALFAGGKTVFDVTSVPYPSKNIPWSQTDVRDLKRDDSLLTSPVIVGTILGLSGISFFFLERSMSFLYFSGSFSWFMHAVWKNKIPYIRITPEKITIYHFPSLKDEIRWDTIRRIYYNKSKNKIRLILIDEKKVINMSILDEDGKKDIITILRNPPCAGIVFSYK
ncbi:MAG: hypothetical protein HXS44_17315 [Theionarchaea archaeon]|nr:hypothetical protein [Theionarchaea archaeon]